MQQKTHPNFKSIIPYVPDAETIDIYLTDALLYQETFDKKTTPWETNLWDKKKLDSFKIIPQEIDRLYCIKHDEFCGIWDDEYYLLARIDRGDGGPLLYVELTAGCDAEGFSSRGDGAIYISSHPSIFMKLTLRRPESNKHLIYQSLRDDGLYVEEPTELDIFFEIYGKINVVPTLQYLCHENINILQNFFSSVSIPIHFKNAMDEFIQYHKAKIAYDNWE